MAKVVAVFRVLILLSIGLIALLGDVGFLVYIFNPEELCEGFGGIDGSVPFRDRVGLYVYAAGWFHSGAACLVLAMPRVWHCPLRRLLLVAVGMGVVFYVVGIILGTDAYFERCG